MGFFSDQLGQNSIAGNVFGGGAAAESTVEAAEQSTAEQRRAFDLAQQNIQPFLDASTSQIPRLQQDATTEGMIANLLGVRESIPQAFGQVIDARGQAGQDAAARAGLSLPQSTIDEISQLPPDVQNALVFDLEQELNRRSQEIFAPGTTTGIELARLGANSASGIGNTLTQGLFAAQEARSAGSENLATIGGGIAGFFSGRGGNNPPPQQNQNFGVPINMTDFSNIA